MARACQGHEAVAIESSGWDPRIASQGPVVASTLRDEADIPLSLQQKTSVRLFRHLETKDKIQRSFLSRTISACPVTQTRTQGLSYCDEIGGSVFSEGKNIRCHSNTTIAESEIPF